MMNRWLHCFELILACVLAVGGACALCLDGNDCVGCPHVLSGWNHLWERDIVASNVVLRPSNTSGIVRVDLTELCGVGMARRLAIRDDGNRVDVYVDWDSGKGEMTNEVFGVRIPYCAPQTVYFWTNPLSPLMAVEEASHE